MIHLERVTKLYGSVIGVNDLSLELGAGAYGLLGPNGSGKTTLINIITGQLRPTLGRVQTLERNPWNNAYVHGRVGVCPTTDALLPRTTAREWVTYLLRLQGLSRTDANQRAERTLVEVGLSDALDRAISGYSKGMRQRVKLAQAMAHEPDLLILDEPFNGLDPIGRHEMTERLKAWVQGGRSLLLASHILHEVEAIAPSFLLICNGRLLASGSAEEVRSLLADLPSEIQFRTPTPTELARRLLAAKLVEGVRVEGETTLVVSTRAPLKVYEALPALSASPEVTIDEIQSPDESLQTLFDSLLKIHRGESP